MSKFRFWQGLILLGFISAFWCGPFFLAISPRISYGDEGFIAQPVMRILQGEVPYRDFFTGVTPGAFYWYALFVKGFSSPFVGLRFGVFVTAFINLSCCLWILRRLGVAAKLPVLLAVSYLSFYLGPFWFVASHHWVSLAWCLIGFACIISIDPEKKSSRWFFACSGFATFFAVFTLQHRGGIWLLSVLPCFLFLPPKIRSRSLFFFVGGFLGGALPASVYFISKVGFDTLIYDLFTIVVTRYHNVDGHKFNLFKELLDVFSVTSSTFYYNKTIADWLRIIYACLNFIGIVLTYLLPMFASVVLWLLWKNKALSKFQLSCLTALFVSAYLSTLYRLAMTTLGFAAPVAVLILALGYHHFIINQSSTKGAQSRYFRTASICWIIIFGGISVSYFLVGLSSSSVTTSTPAGNVTSFLAGEAETMDGVSAFMSSKRQDDEPIFCYSYAAIFYFLLQAPNVTPYDLLSYPINTQEQLDEAQRILDKLKVRWVIWDYYDLDRDTLGRYLSDNYVIVKKYKYVGILERKTDAILR